MHDQPKNEKKSMKEIVDDVRDWPNLPSDVRDLIYTRLFELDKVRFRLTCKAWQCAATHHRRQFPCLMYPSKSQRKGVFKFFCPISNETSVVKIPELAGAVFRCSRFGWLLMSRGDSLFFYHPFISSSTLKTHGNFVCIEFVSMSFTAPPTSPDCIVYAYDISVFGNIVFLYKYNYHSGDNWTEHKFDCNKLPFKTSLCTPVLYKNAFYQLDIHGRLGVSGLKESDDPWKDLPQPIVRKDDTFSFNYRNYIAECDGEMVLVFVDGRRGDEIHVYKLDWSKMQWVTVKSLGSKAMFIGETGSLLIETKGVGRRAGGNKIYFPRFVDERRLRKGQSDAEEKEIGVFYCLETCKYHAFDSNFSGKNWTCTRGLKNFAWIETNLDMDCWLV